VNRAEERRGLVTSTAEVRLHDEPSGERVAEVLAVLRERVRDLPLIAEVYLTPVGIPHGGRSR
jgi:hypothetical protein